jgi:hypothetical protein
LRRESTSIIYRSDGGRWVKRTAHRITRDIVGVETQGSSTTSIRSRSQSAARLRARITADRHVEPVADAGDPLDHRPLGLGGVQGERDGVAAELAGDEVEQWTHLRRHAGEDVDVLDGTAPRG